MLERHFRSLKSVDRIRAQWLGPLIERTGSITRRVAYRYCHCSAACVRVLGHFNEFVVGRGVQRLDELPHHVDAFVSLRLAEHGKQDRATIGSKKPLAC